MRSIATIKLRTRGLGILLYSPQFLPHLREGEDHLSAAYASEDQVQKYVQAGTLVGFGTGTPGDFELRFHEGVPEDGQSSSRSFKLRLGLRVVTEVCCRDLYDLMEWTDEVPPKQRLRMSDGIYRLTLLSDPPASGVLGDNQVIDVVCEKVDQFPQLSHRGIPHLVSS